MNEDQEPVGQTSQLRRQAKARMREARRHEAHLEVIQMERETEALFQKREGSRKLSQCLICGRKYGSHAYRCPLNV